MKALMHIRFRSLWILLLVIPAIASAGQPAGEPFLPISEGADIAGGYQIRQYGLTDEYAQRLWIEGPDGRFEILFTRRDDSRPHIVQTDHCNIVYRSPQSQEGIATPEALEVALLDLQKRSEAHDLRCAASAVYVRPRLTDPLPELPPVLGSSAFPVVLWIVFVVLAFVTGLSKILHQYREASFWTAIAALTVLAAMLRLQGADLPFCESASTQRIQIGASPLWALLSGQVLDYRHPPMTTLLLHGVLKFGRAEELLRFPFALASTVSIPVVGLISYRLSGRLAALGTCALLAVLTPHVEQGREIGSHALFHLALPLTILLHLSVRAHPRRSTAILLGLAMGMALWAHFFAVFLLVGLAFDAAVFAPRRDRSVVGLSLVIATIVGALPLFAFVKGFALDFTFRRLASTAPSAIWGEKTVASVAQETLAILDPTLAITVVGLALAGSLWLIRSKSRRADDAPPLSLLLITAWSIPLAVLAATPLQRMQGIYATLSLPLLCALAMHAASTAPDELARVFRIAKPERDRHVAYGLPAWILVALLVGLSIHVGWSGWSPRVLRFPCSADAAAVAEHIRSTDLRDVAVVYGHSTTLLGFYLIDGVVAEREAEREPHLSVYRDFYIHNLVVPREVTTDWRADAEQKLSELVDRHEEIVLLSFDVGEAAWPELVEAGHCESDVLFRGIETFLCAVDPEDESTPADVTSPTSPQ